MSVSFAKDGNLEADLPRLMSEMHIETLASGSDSRAVSLDRSIEQDVGMGEENGSARNEGLSKKDEGSTQTKKGKKRKQRRSKTAEDLDVETPLEVKTLSLESAIETDDDINGVQNSFEDDPKLNLSISIPLEEQEQTNEEESKIIEESIMESGADGIAAYESANETTQSSSASSLQHASPAKPRTSNQSERLKSFVQQSMQDRYAALNAATNQRKSVAIEKTAEGKDFSRLFLRSPSVNPSDSSRLAFRDFRSQSRISRLPTFSSLSLVDPNGMTQSKALPSYDDLLVSSASSMTVEILKKKIKHIQAQSSSDETRSKSIAVEEVSSKLLAGSSQSHISLLPKSEQSIRSWATDKIVSEVESQPRNAVETLNLDQAIGRIVDDDEYDLTVTYKLPKSAPFDPEDKLKDVRIKCIENWMRDRGNALYESIFEDELKTKAEREFIEELVDKLVALMRKIKKCDACQKRPSISVHSVVASSHSTFSLVESPSAGKSEDEEMAEISPPASVSGEDEDLFATLKEEIDLLGNEMENIFKPKPSQDSKGRGDSYCSAEPDTGKSFDLDREDVEETIVDTTTKRMRFIRGQLERIIGDLEAKIGEEKSEMSNTEPEEEPSAITDNLPRLRICKCDDPWLNGLAENLISHFVTHETPLLHQTESTCILAEKSTRKTREIEITEPEETDDIRRVQMYLLGLTNSWLSQDLTEGKRLESTSGDESKENLSANLRKDHNPVFCKCGCDRISRFNVKKRLHFRSVVDENLDCYYNISNTREHLGGVSENKKGGFKDYIDNEVRKKPNQFKGWLADTDRNLLLMMNRSFEDRLGIRKNKSVDNYGKKPQSNHELENDEKPSRADMIKDVLTGAGETEAKKFWDFVGQTYANYRANDKLRRLIDEFEKVDFLRMLKRDLALLKEQMQLQFDEAKESLRLRIEERQKQKYETAVQKLQESLECQGYQRLVAKRIELDQRKTFQILRLRLEAEENFKLKFREFKKSCVETLKWNTSREHPMITAHREANDILTIVDQTDIGERLRTKILSSVGSEHEELEKAQGNAIKMRNQTIENLKETIVKLNRDIVIWKSAVGEVLISHRKFVLYVLETRPDKAQYVLNLERIYQLKMDGLIEDVQNELKDKQKEQEETENQGKEEFLQPAFAIKCPSHVIRYSSGTATVIGSSSDTDVEQDVRASKIGEHAVACAIRAALPSSEPSDIGEEASEMKEQDAIGFRSFETSPSHLVKETELSVNDVCEKPKAATGIKNAMVIVGDGASSTSIHIDEFTRRRVQEMLGVISRKTPQIKTRVQL